VLYQLSILLQASHFLPPFDVHLIQRSQPAILIMGALELGSTHLCFRDDDGMRRGNSIFLPRRLREMGNGYVLLAIQLERLSHNMWGCLWILYMNLLIWLTGKEWPKSLMSLMEKGEDTTSRSTDVGGRWAFPTDPSYEIGGTPDTSNIDRDR